MIYDISMECIKSHLYITFIYSHRLLCSSSSFRHSPNVKIFTLAIYRM